MGYKWPVKKEYTPEEIEEIDKMRKRMKKLTDTDDPNEDSSKILAEKENKFRQKYKYKFKNPDDIEETADDYSTESLEVIEGQKKSWIDKKTGLRSYQYLEDNIAGILDREKRDYAREGNNYKGFSVMLIDIDNFKAINDNFGHNVGDTVLADVAMIIRGNVRQYDQACRWGGDEFVIILPRCDTNEITKVIERIRNKLSENEFSDKNVGKITLSIGYVNSKELATLKQEEILRRADCAMYYGKKRLGKNSVVSYDGVPEDFSARFKTEKIIFEKK